jgi:hypothetical protein
MPDYPPVRTADGCYLTLRLRPAGPDRLMRVIDGLANSGSSVADAAVWLAGGHGWILEARAADPTDGSERDARIGIRTRHAGEEAAAGPLARARARARAGDPLADLLRLLRKFGEDR